MNKTGPGKKTALFYFFIFLTLIDAPLVILYTITGSAFLVRIMLYGSELVLMMLLVYLLRSPSLQARIPSFIYIYVGYILSVMLISLLFYGRYNIVKHSRKFLVPILPLLLGHYLTLFEEREKYIDRIIVFLTIMSVIGLIEWGFWNFFPSFEQLYPKYFDVASYEASSRYRSAIVEAGARRQMLRGTSFFIPQFRRLTGLYLEPFAAGFNAILVVILVLYNRIAGCQRKTRNYVFLVINLIAGILTTNRSCLFLLFVSLFMYAIIQRKFLFAISPLLLLVAIYTPIAGSVYNSVTDLGGGYHRSGVLAFIHYFWNNLASIKGMLGMGLGSMEGRVSWILYTESGYGTIFGQLGLLGLFVILVLYLRVIARIPFSKENKFFVLSTSISTFVLLLFAGYIFGYKTYGMVYFFLGTIMTHNYVGRQDPSCEAKQTIPANRLRTQPQIRHL